MLTGATAALALSTTATAAEAGSPDAERIRLRLPRPTGPHPVGRTELHLVDRSRPDPWLHKTGDAWMADDRYVLDALAVVAVGPGTAGVPRDGPSPAYPAYPAIVFRR